MPFAAQPFNRVFCFQTRPPCCAQESLDLFDLISNLPWWGWVGLCVILVVLAGCCLLSACCVRLVWKRRRETSLEPRSVLGMEPSVSADDVRAVDAALRARENAAKAARCQGSSCFPNANWVEAPHTALGGASSHLTQPNACWLDLTQPPVVPRMSNLWQRFEWQNQVENLAEPVKSSNLSANRLEYEKDRSNSDPTRPEPPRESERVEKLSSRASNIGTLLNSLRSSFGRVRV
jgi:hypothetical protein